MYEIFTNQFQDELQGGSTLWKIILSFWPLKEERDLLQNNMLDIKCTELINIPEKQLHNCFFVTLLKNCALKKYASDTPILIFFTGMGKTKKIIHKLFENLLLCENFPCYSEIYTLNQMNISCLQSCVQESIQLYNYVKTKYPYKKILFVGHSLGSGIAAQVIQSISLNSQINFNVLGALLLNTAPDITLAIKPFTFLKNILKTISKIFLVNILDTRTALQKTKYPIKIVHTRGDKMYLLKLIEPLQNIVSEFTMSKPFFKITEGDHGEIVKISKENLICNEINIFLQELKIT